jgi:hypothetical protein
LKSQGVGITARAGDGGAEGGVEIAEERRRRRRA